MNDRFHDGMPARQRGHWHGRFGCESNWRRRRRSNRYHHNRLADPVHDGKRSRSLATVTVTAADHSSLAGLQVWMNFSGYPNSPFSHTLDANGQATYHLGSLASQPPATYQVQATFKAQGKYDQSMSAVQSIQVLPAGGGQVTSIAINIPTATVFSGAQYQFSDPTMGMVVTSSDATTPQGKVNVTYYGYPGSGTPDFPGTWSHNLVGGRAAPEYTLWSLPPGTYLVTAEYPTGQGPWGGTKATAKLVVQ